MKTIHVLIGIPGCGKSTFADKLSKQLNIEIVSTDRVRMENIGILEEQVWPKVYQMLGEKLNNDEDVIFDATNITPKVRKRLVDNVRVYCEEFNLIGYYFTVDWRLCMERVEKRNTDPNEHYLPTDVIEGYAGKIIEPTFEEGFIKINYIDEIGNIYKTILK